MPVPLLRKTELLDRLLATLRDRGYDGTSMADLATATGLGKSSLEQHFPGGKEDLARQVLEHLDERLTRALFEPLRSTQSPTRKLAAMLDAIDELHDGGRVASLLARLGASIDRAAFRRSLGHAFGRWIDAVEALCVEAGLGKNVARARAEDLVIRIEGALVLAGATGDPAVFTRTLTALRATSLTPASGA